MQYAYDPFVLRRAACRRVFFVNAGMPFEYFLSCFQYEQPFFLTTHLEDGRVAIIPNAMCIPWNLLQSGFWPKDLLPKDYEYVTMKHGTYPVIISAHPVRNFEEWFKEFTRCVEPFAQQTLDEFIKGTYEFTPVQLGEHKKTMYKEPVTN